MGESNEPEKPPTRRRKKRRTELHPSVEIHLGYVIDTERRDEERRTDVERRDEPRPARPETP
jgi:hypothetical protein